MCGTEKIPFLVRVLMKIKKLKNLCLCVISIVKIVARNVGIDNMQVQFWPVYSIKLLRHGV